MNSLRIKQLKKSSTINTEKYVLYWMQQSQRVHYNHALEHAILTANHFNLPVLVFFGLTASYPEANQRHYRFMLEGLKEVKHILETFNINFVIKFASPEIGILPFLKDTQALVMDQGYLKHQIKWREKVLDYIDENQLHLGVDIVDTDLIVPVEIASNKVEYGAYTLRPKLKKIFQEFRDFTRISTVLNQTKLRFVNDDDLSDINQTIKTLNLDQTLFPSKFYQGGYLAASNLFFEFIDHKAEHYLESNDPSTDYTSKLSMYLHFGQISSLEILERMMMAHDYGQVDGAALDGFIEQLLVRRELAFNYVYYNKGYDQFETMTESWAYKTMKEHEMDQRPYNYTKQQIENSLTHDLYFNAAMKEMVYTGFMHNYMRMYWAKKIIEWMPSFKEAYDTIKYLNNHYFIDGRDPNSYAGIAWCFGKHDRAWKQRIVFGKLRYMNDKGLERKFDINAYVNKIENMISN